MATNVIAVSANFGSGDPISGLRPRIGLALGWVAYGLFHATVAACFIAPVLLVVHLFGVRLG